MSNSGTAYLHFPPKASQGWSCCLRHRWNEGLIQPCSYPDCCELSALHARIACTRGQNIKLTCHLSGTEVTEPTVDQYICDADLFSRSGSRFKSQVSNLLYCDTGSLTSELRSFSSFIINTQNVIGCACIFMYKYSMHMRFAEEWLRVAWTNTSVLTYLEAPNSDAAQSTCDRDR